MDKIIERIINNKTHCYFISPHLDDAVLSAGGLLSYLAGKTPVTLVNVFSAPGEKPYTFAAKRFLMHCGVTDADELYRIRYAEEKNVAKTLAIQSLNLDFIDGSFRRNLKKTFLANALGSKIPELEHSYPLGRLVFGLAKDDKLLMEEIKQKLLQLTAKEKDFIIFCPLGTVKHMDHLITRNVCTAIFDNIVYWTDYPYIQKSKQRVAKNQFIWDKNQEEKKKLIGLYTSQIHMLFPEGKIKVENEIYSME